VSSQGLGSDPDALTVSEMLVEWVADAAVPVTVTGYVPGAVPEPTVKVRVEDPPAVTEVGLKPTVTPDGRPEAPSEIDSALPDTMAVLIEVVPLLAATTPTPVGLAEMEKSLEAGGGTERVTVVECVAEVAVPVTVIGYDPGATLAPTVSFRVEEPPVVTDVGVKPADTPVGRPDAEKAMFSPTPETSAVEIEVVPDDPAATGTVVGLAEIEKSFTGSWTAPVTDTLSKPTLLSWPMLCDVTNKPTVAVVAIATVLELTLFHVIPSRDSHAVRVLPARWSFSHLLGFR
jgi:hypothetical protein